MAKPKSKRRRRLIVVSILVLGLGTLTAVGLTRKRDPVLRVQVEKVSRRNITETVTANGRIQPVLQVKISAEVSGEIIDLPVKEGQDVKQRQTLLTIEAMKMQTTLQAERDGHVGQLLVKSGCQVETGDLLLTIE